MRTVRKLKAYGNVVAPPCPCDYPEAGATVQLSVDAAKVAVHVCDPASGEPLVRCVCFLRLHLTPYSIVYRWTAMATRASI